MVYDALNRVTNTTWNDSGLTPPVTYSYDSVASRRLNCEHECDRFAGVFQR